MDEMNSYQGELEKIEAAIAAQDSLRGILPDDEINQSLEKLNLKKQAILLKIKDGAAVIGNGSQAVGEEGILVSRLGKNARVVIAKDNARIYLGDEPVEMPAVDRESCLGQYLEYVIANNRFLQLQGIRSGGRLVNIELDQIYISLRTSKTRERKDEDEWLSVEVGLTPGELSRQKLERAQVSESMTLGVEEALSQNRHLVILGDPGSGKTTLLRFLALLFARDMAEGTRQVQERLKLSEEGVLPILIPLRRVGSFLQVRQPKEDGTEGSGLFIEFLIQLLKQERISLPADFFDSYLYSGKAIMLFDGLDEVADPEVRRRVARLIESTAFLYQDCRFVITSRIVGYKGAVRLAGRFAVTTVCDFTMADVRRFLANWHRLVAVGQMGLVQSALDSAESQTDSLMEAIEKNERIRELAINPLLLTVIALVHRDRVKLPDRRAELYAEAVDVLLGKWDEARGVKEMTILPDRPFDAGDKRIMLQSVAMHMHLREEKEISAADLQQMLSEMFSSILPDPQELRRVVDRFLEVVEARSGILVSRGEGMYAFSHLTFQEYLAALCIAGQSDYIEFTLARAEQAWWREVILLEAGYLSTQSRERTGKLIQAILNHPAKGEPFASLVLAADCLRDVGSYRVPGNLEEAIRARLRSEMETRPVKGFMGSLRTRLQRGMTADQLADRRRAAAAALVRVRGEIYWGGPYAEPDWVEIPAGKFWMGSEEFPREQPPHEVDLPSFRIARVPITHAQYSVFVRETSHPPPAGWDGAHFPRGYDSHPVVNVSWHDSLEYCRWLRLVTGKAVTLPGEAEWEKAARGTDRREYPWGNEFDPSLCNSAESGLGDTSPVGLFSDGASPYGVLDMAGNVWELTRSLWGEDWEKPLYGYPYKGDDGRESLDAPKNILRVLRGGAFDYESLYVRCACRYWYYPGRRGRSVGFRVVVSPFSGL